MAKQPTDRQLMNDILDGSYWTGFNYCCDVNGITQKRQETVGGRSVFEIRNSAEKAILSRLSKMRDTLDKLRTEVAELKRERAAD